MKIQAQHIAHMRQAIEASPRIPWTQASALGHSPMRYRWDVMHAAGLTPWLCSTVYPYANDANVDTALRSILPETVQA